MRRSCEEYEELISEFLDGELSKEEQLALMKHMSGCPVCQKYFDDLVAMHEAMEEMEVPAVPEGFAERVMAQVRETKQDPAPKKTAFRWKRWAALAACCAIAVGGLWVFRGGRKDSSQAAVTANMPYAYQGVPAGDAPEEAGEALDHSAGLPDTAADGMVRSVMREDAAEPDAPMAAAAPAAETPKSTQDAVLENSPPAPEPAAGYSSAKQADSTLLEAEDARNIALAHAGLTAEDVTFTATKLDWEDGKQVYEVEFFSPSAQYDSAERTEYDYDIDAVTGAVVKYSAEKKDLAPAPASTPIAAEDARAKALAHAGLTAADVTFTKTELDWENGKQVYEVEFYTAAGAEYDYEIDTAGEIVRFDYDAESYAPPASAGTITREKAREIALGKVPGASADHITKLELDYDDGAAVYEVEIVYGGVEYDLEISGDTGAVLEFEAEG